MKIAVINAQTIEKALPMNEAITALKDSLRAYSAGTSDIPLRTNIPVPAHNGQSLYMPGYESESGALGVKIVSVYPDNFEKGLPSVPAVMVLSDEKTGMVSAILDGTSITRLRTGASGGAAADLLARRDASVFALFGTGGQAETQLEAVLSVRNIRSVLVYDISAERAQAFAEKMGNKFAGRFPAVIRAAASPADAVRDADIITAVTTSKTPVFDGRLVKKGAHVSSIGSYTPEMSEIDEYVVVHAGKRYVDTRNGALAESGCLIQPINRGKLRAEDVTGELGELILGKTPGRQNDSEITYYDCVGSAVMDIVTAKRIYERVLLSGDAQFIEL